MYEASERDESLRVDFPFSGLLILGGIFEGAYAEKERERKKEEKPQGERCMPSVGIERTTLLNSIRFSR
jgi:hypothetical protein